MTEFMKHVLPRLAYPAPTRRALFQRDGMSSSRESCERGVRGRNGVPERGNKGAGPPLPPCPLGAPPGRPARPAREKSPDEYAHYRAAGASAPA